MLHSAYYNQSMALEDQNGYKSLHSCSRRPTLPQITAYLMIITMNIAFWSSLQKHFANSTTRFVMISLFSVSLVILLLTGLITSILDPSDPILQQYRSGNSEVYRRHLDECLYCDFCRSYVLQSSRHCKQCDRCIKRFDHHCIWINNCIGDFNYCQFIAMIFSTVVHLLLYIIAVALLWSEDTWGSYIGEMVFIWVVGIFAIIFTVMVSGLIGLHMYLIRNGMTTFEYILSRKTLTQRMKFSTPIKPKVQQNHRPTSEHFQTIEHQVTENNYQPSAFGDITVLHQLERSQIPSGEYLKEKPQQKQSFPKLTPFQIIQVANEDEQERHLKELYRSNRSLKLLVGSSVKVKERKSSIGSLNESHSSRSRSRKMTGQSLRSNKAENVIALPVMYFKEPMDEEELDRTK